MGIYTKTITAVAFCAAISFVASGTVPVKRPLIFGPSQAEGAIAAKALAPESEEETWKEIGEGVLRDDLFTTMYFMDSKEFPVRVQESEQHPGRYRLVNAWSQLPELKYFYGSHLEYPADREVYIVVDATNPERVHMEQGFIGAYTGEFEEEEDGHYGPQEGVVWSKMHDYLTKNSAHFTEADVPTFAGRLQDGAITFPKAALLWQPWDASMVDEDGSVLVYTSWLQWNINGNFRILLPGAPRVDVGIELEGYVAESNAVEYTLTLQDDVAYAKAAVCEGESVSAFREGIIDGTIPSVQITESGKYQFPYVSDGLYTIVVVPYTSDDTPRYESSLTRTFDFDESEWRKVKEQARYTEGVLCDNEMSSYGFEISPEVYYVDIEENVKKPGLIRIVEPYGKNYSYTNANNYDFSQLHYLEIDAADPHHVFINKTEDFIGLDLGYKSMIIWSRASRYLDRGYTMEEVIEMEKDGDPIFGKVENDVVTFPKDALLLSFVYIRPDTWYAANCHGRFRLELPKGIVSGIEGVGHIDSDMDADAPVEYFTISGMRVDGDLLPGIYVARRGSKTWKTAVK